MMKSKMFFFIHFFILMVILDALKYKGGGGGELKINYKNLILVENNVFTFCLLLLTFIFIKCTEEKLIICL